MTSKNDPINLRYQNMRIAYIIAVFITILLGLSSRKFSHLIQLFVAQNAGDVLWAMMIYFGFRFLLVRRSLFTAIWLSFSFCFGIEFSQLYQDELINQIRNSFLGALILGKGFLIVDLVRYTVGILIASATDFCFFDYTKKRLIPL